MILNADDKKRSRGLGVESYTLCLGTGCGKTDTCIRFRTENVEGRIMGEPWRGIFSQFGHDFCGLYRKHPVKRTPPQPVIKESLLGKILTLFGIP